MNEAPAPAITYVDDARLIDIIRQAKYRVLLMTPGVSDEVAKALEDAWQRLGPEEVTVIADVDPEVCRLGYGTIDALQRLRESAALAGTVLNHQKGLRIGLVVADGLSVVFSPAPLLIEAGSKQPERPNAIRLESLPANLARDIGFGERKNLERVVGLDPVTPNRIAEVAQDLEQAPPAKFDLARQVRVFTARFQFVEFELKGCYVSRKKVQIPSHLIGLAGHRDIETRFHAQFDLLAENLGDELRNAGESVTEKDLMNAKRKIVECFLIPLKGYGSVVMKSNKKALVEAVASLKNQVEQFQQAMAKHLDSLIDQNIKQLIRALLPAVYDNPPAEYIKYGHETLTREGLSILLGKDLNSAFGSARGHISGMEVKLTFKDVTYESLADDKFLKIVYAAIPGLESTHDEYDAAPADRRSPTE